MTAPVTFSPSMSEIQNARLVLHRTMIEVEMWESRLDPINRGIVSDPGGNEGARLESLILRGQAIIGERIAFLTGVPVERLDHARGVAL